MSSYGNALPALIDTRQIAAQAEDIADLEDLVTELLDKLETAEGGRYRAMVESIRAECDFPADKVRTATGYRTATG